MSERFPNEPAPVRRIDQQRIRDKVDDYMSRRDYPGVERHLLYWLEEARMGRDGRGELMVLNELVGHYRKTQERDKAVRVSDEALALLDALDFSDTISAGTTYINIATCMNSFGEDERAIGLFERARAIYEASPSIDHGLLGGLYNNMALSCAALGRWDEGMRLYDLAMEHIGHTEYGAWEQAVTCLNRANLIEARLGMEAAEGQIYALLDQALELLETPEEKRGGYYAYICETCAPTFEYYGYFMDAERLNREAQRIYAGS